MNKKLFSVAASLLVIGLILVPGTVSASGYVNDADITVVEGALNAINTFTTAFSDTSVPASTVIGDGTSAQASLSDLANHSFVSNLGSSYTEAANALKNDANAISSDIGTIDTALQTNDQSKASGAITSLNTDVGTFNTDKTTLNNAVDHQNKTTEHAASQQTLGYLALLIGTVVLAIGSFVWARRRSTDSELLYRARRKVAVASIWPVVGAGITYGTFVAASGKGGTYYIAYGPIIIGAVAFLRALSEYKIHRQQAAAGPIGQPIAPMNPAIPPTNPMPIVAPVEMTPPVSPVSPIAQSTEPVPPAMPQFGPIPPTNPVPPTNSTVVAPGPLPEEPTLPGTPPNNPTPPVQPPTA